MLVKCKDVWVNPQHVSAIGPSDISMEKNGYADYTIHVILKNGHIIRRYYHELLVAGKNAPFCASEKEAEYASVINGACQEHERAAACRSGSLAQYHSPDPE